MPFPEIKHCLIADSVRPEAFGKVTLLGFFGVAPDVSINVKNFANPLELGFLLLGGTGDAAGTIQFQLVDSNSQVLVATPPGTVQMASDGKRMSSALGITHRYAGPGRYALRLVLDGKPHYDAWFELLQGQPQHFQG